MSQPLTERYRERLAGVLSCYDRIIVTGTLPGACYANLTVSISSERTQQSGSILHERGHPHTTACFSALVIDRQRCCSARCLPSIAFKLARIAET